MNPTPEFVDDGEESRGSDRAEMSLAKCMDLAEASIPLLMDRSLSDQSQRSATVGPYVPRSQWIDHEQALLLA